MMSNDIDKFNNQSDSKRLIIVNFENGNLSKHGLGQVDQVNVNNSKVSLRLTHGHEYIGEVENRQKDYLIIRRKRTNEVLVVGAHKVRLQHSKLVNNLSETIPIEEGYSEKYAALQRSFGGKKQMRRVEQKERYKLDVSAVEQSLEQSAKDVPTEVLSELKSTKEQVQESLIDILPHCNRDAQKIEDVYVINELLIDNLYQEALAGAEELANTPLNDDLSDTAFGFHCWTSAQKVKSESALAAAFVLPAILRLIKLKTKELRPSSAFSTSKRITEFVLNTFCTKSNNRINRSLTQRDKALVYICILGFLSCNYKIPLDILAHDVGIGLTKLAKLCRIVGAVPEVRGSNIYHLKLPLPPLPASAHRVK